MDKAVMRVSTLIIVIVAPPLQFRGQQVLAANSDFNRAITISQYFGLSGVYPHMKRTEVHQMKGYQQ